MAARSKTALRRFLQVTVLRGFTLVEVLVASAILALAVTSILAAQYGAIKRVSTARYISLAVPLTRCKMTEIEERLQRDGFAELNEEDSGPCCESDDHPEFTCEWRIEKPEFPEPALGELDLDTDLDTTSIGKLAGADGSPDAFGAPGQGLGGISDALGGDVGDIAAGGIGGIAQTVMGMVYPDMKLMFEASTRRVTVTTRWREGSAERDLTIVQWVTNPQQGGLVGELPEGVDPATGAATGGTGTGTTGGPSTTKSGGGR